MVTIQEIRDDEKVAEWLDYYKSDNTINGYLSALKKYVIMTQKPPSELIEEAVDESGYVIPKRKYLKYLDKFYILLKNGDENNKPLAEKSINKNMQAVISFYNHHRIEIINPHLNKSAKTKAKNNEVPPVDIIRKALHAATPMLYAYILVATSSGLSVSDIVRLKIKDIKNVDENDITVLKLIRHKTGTDFYTFFSPEATRAIRTYIDGRNGSGTNKGTVGENWRIKHRINSDEDYLFIKENIRDKEYFELLEKDYQAAEEYRRMTEYNFEDNFRYLSKFLNLEGGKGNYNVIRTHNFRKYFITTLTDLGMGIGDVHFLAGKELPAGFTPYHKPDGFRTDAIDEWKDRYIDCLNSLMFGEKINDITKNKYKKLEAEFKAFKTESKIKMIEIEMNAEIKPDQIAIQDLLFQIEEINGYIKSGKQPDERLGHKNEFIALSQLEIKNLKRVIQKKEGEIREKEFEIQQTKDYYIDRMQEVQNEE